MVYVAPKYEKPETREVRGFIKRVWLAVEWLDWCDIPPKRMWRFFLRKIDEYHGYKNLDYDY